MSQLNIVALNGIPTVNSGDDLTQLVMNAVEASQLTLENGDILSVAHKIVSKAEGRVKDLRTVSPSPEALRIAKEQSKDPRTVQVVLDESVEILREEKGVLICVTRHGFVCANAGVDSSNSGSPEQVILLPKNPDGSARKLKESLTTLTGVKVGVVVSDSFGRAWRSGQTDVAVGCSGIKPIVDWRGSDDRDKQPLKATVIAAADQITAAADLARSKSSSQPVVLIKGLAHLVTGEESSVKNSLVRAVEEDLFRT